MSRRMRHPTRAFDWAHFREHVVAYQHRHHMSGRELADSIGMSPGTLFGWLNGSRRSVSGDAMASLAHVADLDLNIYIIDPLESAR